MGGLQYVLPGVPGKVGRLHDPAILLTFGVPLSLGKSVHHVHVNCCDGALEDEGQRSYIAPTEVHGQIDRITLTCCLATDHHFGRGNYRAHARRIPGSSSNVVQVGPTQRPSLKERVRHWSWNFGGVITSGQTRVKASFGIQSTLRSLHRPFHLPGVHGQRVQRLTNVTGIKVRVWRPPINFKGERTSWAADQREAME